MVKWVYKAAQLGLVGIAIIHFGYSRELPVAAPEGSLLWHSQVHVALGVTLVLLSLATMGYAILTFKARSRRVYARRKIRFDDVTGPSILTFIMVGAILLAAANRVGVRYGPMLSHNELF
jgi:uncharacterized membrane protein YidH (DUF202 family)